MTEFGNYDEINISQKLENMGPQKEVGGGTVYIYRGAEDCGDWCAWWTSTQLACGSKHALNMRVCDECLILAIASFQRKHYRTAVWGACRLCVRGACTCLCACAYMNACGISLGSKICMATTGMQPIFLQYGENLLSLS